MVPLRHDIKKQYFLVILSICMGTFCFAGEWNDHLIELEQYEGRAKTIEKKMRELAHEMQSSSDKGLQQTISQDLIAQSSEMKRILQKMQKERSHVRFEHPEKGQEIETKYKRYSNKNFADLQKQLGIDKLLAEVAQHVRRKYSKSESCKTGECPKEGVPKEGEVDEKPKQDSKEKPEVQKSAE